MKTKINDIFFIFLLFVVIVIGCKKGDNQKFTDTPIIESYLEPDSFLNITITRQIPFSTDVDYSPDDINNLSVKILYNNSTHILTPIGNGKYVDSTLVVKEGDNYNLSFTYNSKNVSAYTYIPSKPVNIVQSETVIKIERMDSTSGPPSLGTMPDPVTITWDNTDASYYLVIVENMEPTLDPIRDFGDKTPPGNMFRKSPTNSSSEEIRAMDFQYYGTHRVILFHVLPDYAALYEQNSTSSQNLTNPSSSIVNGYGIFTGLNSDSLYIEVSEP